jgi:hypothetical protein
LGVVDGIFLPHRRSIEIAIVPIVALVEQVHCDAIAPFLGVRNGEEKEHK